MGTNADKHARQQQNRGGGGGAGSSPVGGSGRSRPVVIMAVLAAAALALSLIVVFTGANNSSDDEESTSTSTSTSTTAADTVELPAPPEGMTLTDQTPCPPAEGTEQRVQAFAGPPPMCIDPAASYTATFDTTEGTFTAELDAATAPNTVNNFVVLARYHTYDGVPFHRIVSGFVIQAGDADGEPWGSNDLGYTLADELPASSDAYVDHSLVMANAGPNTNGSQFFVVLPGGGASLQPLYSLFGQVTEGTEVVDAIGLMSAGEQPTKAVVINSVTIDETPAAG